MAAVTLKDLMDPLSKIEAAAKETNEKLDALIAVSGSSNSGGGLDAAIVAQLTAQTDLLTAIEANTSRNPLGGMFSKKGGGAKKSNAGATLEDLGLGAKITAKAMMLWLLVPKKSLSKFKGFVVDTLTAFEKVKPKKVKAGADALAVASGAAMISAKALMMWMFVPESAIEKFTSYITKLDKTLSKTTPKKAKKGAEALGLMGDALLKFAKGLALAAILVPLGLIAVPFLLLAVTAIGGIMALIGGKKFSKRIGKGAKTLDKVGDALKSFAIGISLFVSFQAPSERSFRVSAAGPTRGEPVPPS